LGSRLIRRDAPFSPERKERKEVVGSSLQIERGGAPRNRQPARENPDHYWQLPPGVNREFGNFWHSACVMSSIQISWPDVSVNSHRPVGAVIGATVVTRGILPRGFATGLPFGFDLDFATTLVFAVVFFGFAVDFFFAIANLP
jgi:hypothetical protein